MHSQILHLFSLLNYLRNSFSTRLCQSVSSQQILVHALQSFTPCLPVLHNCLAQHMQFRRLPTLLNIVFPWRGETPLAPPPAFVISLLQIVWEKHKFMCICQINSSDSPDRFLSSLGETIKLRISAWGNYKLMHNHQAHSSRACHPRLPCLCLSTFCVAHANFWHAISILCLKVTPGFYC